MIPLGVAIIGIHSVCISDDDENISLYLECDDGSTACAYVSLVALAECGHIIEPATQPWVGAVCRRTLRFTH